MHILDVLVIKLKFLAGKLAFNLPSAAFQVGPWGCPHFPLQEPCMRLSPHTARVILLIISRFK